MFRTQIDLFNDTQEVNQGEDRAIKCDFSITLQGYIIPDTINKDLASTKKGFSKAVVRMTEEAVSSIPTDNNQGVQFITQTPVRPFSTVIDQGNIIVLQRGGEHTCSLPSFFTSLTDSTQAPIYYIGWTKDNITYYITRITLSLNIATTAEAVGDWGDRYTLIYT
jgi:hypothetical protein